MGTVLLILVVCLMIGFVLLSFIQKNEDSNDESPNLTLDQLDQIKEKFHSDDEK